MLYADSRWLKWETLSKCNSNQIIEMLYTRKTVETSTLGPTRVDEVTAMRKILDMWWHMARFRLGIRQLQRWMFALGTYPWNRIGDVSFLQCFVG